MERKIKRRIHKVPTFQQYPRIPKSFINSSGDSKDVGVLAEAKRNSRNVKKKLLKCFTRLCLVLRCDFPVTKSLINHEEKIQLLTHSLSHTHTHVLTHTLTHSLCLSICLSLSLSLPLCLSVCLSASLSLSLGVRYVNFFLSEKMWIKSPSHFSSFSTV